MEKCSLEKMCEKSRIRQIIKNCKAKRLGASKEKEEIGKRLDYLTNIIEISNYINSYLSDENLIPMMNDMIIGVTGAEQSTIYLFENDELVVKSTTATNGSILLPEECLRLGEMGGKFIINSIEPLKLENSDAIIRSRMGVPISRRDKVMGYIVIEHKVYNYITEEHSAFLTAVSSQVAIALENAVLYSQMKNLTKLDPLIGIYNRRAFFEIVQEYIKDYPKAKYAIVMMDLDNFKSVNDTLGHQFGDEVIIKTARLAKKALKEENIIARYGGEEIIIFINEAEKEEEIFDYVDEIRENISKTPVTLNDVSTYITTSIGLSFFGKDGITLTEVIKSADNLLYIAKRSGKNKVCRS